jgi:hypothetical protein
LVGTSSWTYIAYLFASVPGISKVGTYTGNGTSQTIDCGFTAGARFVMIKRTDSTSQWPILDSSRSPNNQVILNLNANLADGEYSGFGNQDFLSNGFKLRTTDSGFNTNGATYIYMAFAESPFKTSLAR